MMIIAIGSFAFGALLGARFGLLTLILAISSFVFFSIVADFVKGSDLTSVAIHAVLAAAGMQLGYIGGALSRSFLVHRWGSPLASHDGASLNTSYDQA
jgi:hypothetical protein